MSLQVWLPLNGNLNNNGLARITHTGIPIYNNGKFGKALDLLNSPQITINCSKLSNISKFSICFWIKGTKDSNDGDWASPIHFTVNKKNGTENDHFRFGKDNRASSNGHPICMFNNSHYSISTSNSLTFASQNDWDTWVHVCFTTDGTNMKAYLNGTLKSSATNGTNGWLTGIIKLRSERYNGFLNDFRVYDHVLSAKEVEEISKGLVLHHQLNNNGLGGNNLLTGTNDFSEWYLNSRWSKNGKIATYSTGPKAWSDIDSPTISWSEVQGKTLTISAELRSDDFNYTDGSGFSICFVRKASGPAATDYSTRRLECTPIYLIKNQIITKWKKYSSTILNISDSSFTNTYNGGGGDWFGIYIWNYTNKSVQIKNIKLEIGNIATNYSPAPIDIGMNPDIIYDSSGYNNNGNISSGSIELISSPRYSIGSSSLNAINTKIVTTLNELPAILANGTKYTLACWARPTGTNSNGWVIQLGNNQCGLWWAKSEARWVWNENDNGKRCANPTISSDYTNWHHLVTTVDKTNPAAIVAKHYVDGQPAEGYASQTWNGSTFTQPTGNTITYYLQNSDLSDVRLYTTVLTEDQIKELCKISKILDGVIVQARDLEVSS